MKYNRLVYTEAYILYAFFCPCCDSSRQGFLLSAAFFLLNDPWLLNGLSMSIYVV